MAGIVRRRNSNECGVDQEGQSLKPKQTNPKQQQKEAVLSQQHLAPPPLSDRREPFCPAWTKLTEGCLHWGIRYVNVSLAVTAARYPKRCVLLVALLSFGLVIVGFLTNFVLLVRHEEIFTPMGSRPQQHAEWIRTESNFVKDTEFAFLLHSNGEDVMNVDAISRLFFVLDTVRNISGYDSLCRQSAYLNANNEPMCWLWSATKFWNHNVTEFETTVKVDSDVARILSHPRFQDGTPVFQEALFGEFEATNQTFVYNAIADQIFYYQHDYPYLIYVPEYFVTVGMPEVDDAWPFQEHLLEVLQQIRTEWQNQSPEENPNNIQLEFFCSYAYELEYGRALIQDFPLLPIVFFVMLGFTCFIFHRYGLQQEDAPTRATLGVTSTVTVGMSLMSGFGLMFCLGIPFTNITLMAPFIILGVGLDDTFIITGAYFRRIKEEIEQGKYDILLCNQDQIVAPLSSTSEESGMGTTDGNNVRNRTRSKQKQSGLYSSTGNDSRSMEQLINHSHIVERVRATLEEVGLSISLTTLTTTTAFILGCISTIPGVRWLCLYCGATIVFDFLYQITFFIALLVLDERRVVLAQAKAMAHHTQGNPTDRQQPRSCCSPFSRLCQSQPPDDNDDSDGDDDINNNDGSNQKYAVWIERFMAWYARKLLTPHVRNTVLFLCMMLFGVCVYSTTQLEQRFDAQDYIPRDSYVQGFLASAEEYSALELPMEIYFRNVNQSDPNIQEQMLSYIYEISALPEIGAAPDFCWVVDMLKYMNGDFSDLDDLTEEQGEMVVFLATTLQQSDLTFEEKLNTVLSVPTIRDVYGSDIVRNEKGEITASRCYIYVRDYDLQDIKEQVDFLFAQREITEAQPINQRPENQNEWAFFTYSSFHPYWEVYAVSIDELIFTTISGVVAVCVVGFLLIPHWSGVLFVGPLIIMLYFDLLGIMQFCGIDINAVTYVLIVVSIGLLVDFLMHILLRYYETEGENREEKVIKTLETMGASMMLGGFTTWLGVIPLAFSTTAIFMTVFIAFLAMVSLGLLIGLAFLPAILSVFGPIVYVTVHHVDNAPEFAATSPTETMESPSSIPGHSFPDTDENFHPRPESKEPETQPERMKDCLTFNDIPLLDEVSMEEQHSAPEPPATTPMETMELESSILGPTFAGTNEHFHPQPKSKEPETPQERMDCQTFNGVRLLDKVPLEEQHNAPELPVTTPTETMESQSLIPNHSINSSNDDSHPRPASNTPETPPGRIKPSCQTFYSVTLLDNVPTEQHNAPELSTSTPTEATESPSSIPSSCSFASTNNDSYFRPESKDPEAQPERTKPCQTFDSVSLLEEHPGGDS